MTTIAPEIKGKKKNIYNNKQAIKKDNIKNKNKNNKELSAIETKDRNSKSDNNNINQTRSKSFATKDKTMDIIKNTKEVAEMKTTKKQNP